eukprot:scaffold22877_cov24-Tisochrysis_lutea.AAC.2
MQSYEHIIARKDSSVVTCRDTSHDSLRLQVVQSCEYAMARKSCSVAMHCNVMQSYENEMRHPLRNLLMGQLVRSLLIQVGPDLAHLPYSAIIRTVALDFGV